MLAENDEQSGETRQISDEEFKSLVGSALFKGTPRGAREFLRAAMRPKRLKAGERLIAQGDNGEEMYIIQEGSCIVSFERDGSAHEVCRLKHGDLVGEMAVLTGEGRIANVDAEEDLLVWGITREAFDRACEDYPEVREYLSEIVTYRFSGQKATADRTVGKYRIEKVIGRGGWSVVYGGVHSFLNLPVAIKMLKHDMAMDPDFLERFQNEAKIVARLNHENIVRVYDIEHIYRTVFIVMEFLEGVSLAVLLDRSPRLSLPRILETLVQTARGLVYAHQEGIIHQDIKPANLYVCRGDQIKILDFGLACHKDEETGEWEGTPHYMAPEQIEGDAIDDRTDIYSLGITAFEMATGRLPFTNPDISEVMRSHMNEPLPDPLEFNPGLPAAFRDFIYRATQKDPADRFANMGEVLSYLMPLAAEFGSRPVGDTHEPKKIMNLSLTYEGTLQLELNELMEDFGQRLKALGIEVHVGSMQKL